MDSSVKTEKSGLQIMPRGSLFTAAYWREAARQMTLPKMLVFAALIAALRVTVKLFRIPLAAGLSLTFDCYVNALGSMVYGPIVALLVGAVSDTVGALLFQSGAYFFPFIFVEMASSFLFALFLWRRQITAPRVLASKFTVNFVCNIIMTSLIMKWDIWFFSGREAMEAYSLINLVRIAKNLVLFPLESVLIVAVLGAFIPALRQLHIVPAGQGKLVLEKKHIILMEMLTLASVSLILLYVFFLKDFLAVHNIKLL